MITVKFENAMKTSIGYAIANKLARKFNGTVRATGTIIEEDDGSWVENPTIRVSLNHKDVQDILDVIVSFEKNSKTAFFMDVIAYKYCAWDKTERKINHKFKSSNYRHGEHHISITVQEWR